MLVGAVREVALKVKPVEAVVVVLAKRDEVKPPLVAEEAAADFGGANKEPKALADVATAVGAEVATESPEDSKGAVVFGVVVKPANPDPKAPLVVA